MRLADKMLSSRQIRKNVWIGDSHENKIANPVTPCKQLNLCWAARILRHRSRWRLLRPTSASCARDQLRRRVPWSWIRPWIQLDKRLLVSSRTSLCMARGILGASPLGRRLLVRPSLLRSPLLPRLLAPLDCFISNATEPLQYRTAPLSEPMLL